MDVQKQQPDQTNQCQDESMEVRCQIENTNFDSTQEEQLNERVPDNHNKKDPSRLGQVREMRHIRCVQKNVTKQRPDQNHDNQDESIVDRRQIENSNLDNTQEKQPNERAPDSDHKEDPIRLVKV
jgi:hypothetical protein